MTEKFKYTVILYPYHYENPQYNDPLSVQTNEDVASWVVAQSESSACLKFSAARMGEDEVSEFVIFRHDIRMVEQYEN